MCVGPGHPPAWNCGQHPPADSAGERQTPGHCTDPHFPEEGRFPGSGSRVGLGQASGLPVAGGWRDGGHMDKQNLRQPHLQSFL